MVFTNPHYCFESPANKSFEHLTPIAFVTNNLFDTELFGSFFVFPQNFNRALGIVHVGGCDFNIDQQAQTINYDVPFATFDTLATIKTLAFIWYDFASFHRLAVDNEQRWFGLTPGCMANHSIQGIVNSMPTA